MPADTRSPAPPAPTRAEHVTTTGWRLVGRAAALVADAAAASPLPAGRDEDVLFAAKFRLRPRLGTGSAVPAAIIALGAAVARDWPDAPPLTRDRPLTRAPGRFHGLHWATEGENGAWMGELLWRHPHPVVAGAPCTTHAILSEQSGHTTLALRVTADGGPASVRGLVGAGQARPPVLSELHRALRLLFDGGDGEPRPLGDAAIEPFVREVLLSETREHPIAVLAPLESGEYVVPPEVLAEELLGLAHLHVIDRHPTTFRLTDTLGDKRLSCFWGALRIYLPGFSCAERPEDHPLLLRERLIDPVVRAGLLGKLGLFAAERVQMPPGLTERRGAGAGPPAIAVPPTGTPHAHAVLAPDAAAPNAATPNELAPDEAVAPAPTSAASAPSPSSAAIAAPLAPHLAPLLTGLGAQLGALAATIAELVTANQALTDEIARLRTTNAVRAVNTTSLERRIGNLETLLQQHLAPDALAAPAADAAPEPARAADEGEDDGDEALTLVDVLRQAATAHSDALLVLDGAERAAAESPYVDVDRLAVILGAMADVARRRQAGALGIPLRDAFRELGIDYRGGISHSTSEKQRKQYLVRSPDGREFDCHEHIALGSSYDPRHCLRVYFTSRAPLESRFVIGHVGRHFDVKSTS